MLVYVVIYVDVDEPRLVGVYYTIEDAQKAKEDSEWFCIIETTLIQ